MLEFGKQTTMTERDLFVKSGIFPLYDLGKDLEIRILDRWTENIAVGDILFINKKIRRSVKEIRAYDSFEEMLKVEDASRIAPGYTRGNILNLLQKIYPKLKSKILVFELVPI